MPADPYTPAELDAVAHALLADSASGVEHHNDNWTPRDFQPQARMVLDAAAPLIAARVRAQVAEEIAADIETMRPMRPQRYRDAAIPRGAAALRARAHATTKEDPS